MSWWEACSTVGFLYQKFSYWTIGSVLWWLPCSEYTSFVCETWWTGFKWERFSLSKGIPTLVTACLWHKHLGYSWFRKAKLGLGLCWSHLVFSVRFTHSHTIIIYKYETHSHLSYHCKAHSHLHCKWGSFTLALPLWGSLTVMLSVVRLTHSYAICCKAHSHLHYECEAHSHLCYHCEAHS